MSKRDELVVAKDEAYRAYNEADRACKEAVHACNEAGRACNEAVRACNEAYRAWNEAYRAWYEARRALEEHDKEGRVITCDYGHFYLITVYTPNSGSELKRLPYRQQWDKDFLSFLKNLEKTKLGFILLIN